jgi:glutamate-1-semialdehyde 2,1-aminomutase
MDQQKTAEQVLARRLRELSSPNSDQIRSSSNQSGPTVTPIIVSTEAQPKTELKVKKTAKSAALYDEARLLIPGGASSILRWASYEPYPLYVEEGHGPKIVDVDGNSYLDYLLGYGALINGHTHPKIVSALKEQAEKGSLFGTPVELEVKLARKFKQMVPSSDMVIFGSNGTDATSNAIRIARAATGKDVVLKFEGHYHGQHDYAMISVEAPPSVAGLEEYPRPLPYSAGIPSLVIDTVIVSPWNNLRAFERIMKRHRNEVAAIIMEPIMANSGVILPMNADYLKSVKEIASQNDALLIFDEVVTGFRVAPGGAQQMYGVSADLSTWGKALGGGAPISAVSGKKEFMDLIGPGKASYGGTYYANSLALAGALANLEILSANDNVSFSVLKARTTKLMSELSKAADKAGQDVFVQGAPGMFSLSFTKQKKIMNYRESLLIDWNKFRLLSQILLNNGVFIHPDNYERMTLSTVHTEEDLEATIRAFEDAFKQVRDFNN